MKKRNDIPEKHSTPFLKSIVKSISKEERAAISARMALAEKIHEGMKAKGLTQRRFATLMGKTAPEISRWLSGTHNFTVDTLNHIQLKLGIRLLDTEAIKPVEEVIRVTATVKRPSKTRGFQGGVYVASEYSIGYNLTPQKLSSSTK